MAARDGLIFALIFSSSVGLLRLNCTLLLRLVARREVEARHACSVWLRWVVRAGVGCVCAVRCVGEIAG